MNDARRKELAKALKLLEDAKSIIEDCGGEEREGFENLSEGLQASERGERMDEVATALEEACDAIDDLVSDIEGACG